jgi:hypothetical protein
MSYTKPEIVLSGSAVVTIQGMGKIGQTNWDINTGSPLCHTYSATVNAYDADE